MDPNNYVAPYGDGWIVVINGAQVGGIYTTQQQAEQVYNSAGGPTDGTTNNNTTDTTTNDQDWAKLWESLTGSNREQFDAQQRNLERDLYSRLVMGLLSGATSLQRPEDWLKYAEYTQGGQNIFNRLYGNTPVPSFGAPSGYSSPATLETIMRDLFGGGSGSGGGGGTGGKTVAQMRQELYAASGNMEYWLNAPDSAVIAEYTKLSGGNTANTTGSTFQGPAKSGATEDTTGGPLNRQRTAMTMATAPITGVLPQGENNRTPGGESGSIAQPVQMRTAGTISRPSSPWQGTEPPGVSGVPTRTDPNWAPLPHQINPMVWDSLSDTAKKMILAAAAKGKTDSGFWTPEDFLAQFNASRPRGNAPRSIFTQYSSPSSYF